MRLSELVHRWGVPTARRGADLDPVLSDLTFDSRAAGPGTLFIALTGAALDGHDFVRGAVAHGASAVLVATNRLDHFADLTVPVVAVDDPRRRLGALAAAFYGDPSTALDVVGITGTNGKTTVSFLVEAVLLHASRPCGVVGTVNYRWPGHVEPAPNTTPESLVVQRLLSRMRDDGVRAVAMEVSSHGLATHRLDGVAFDVGVFTNLTQDHLDFHGSMENYRDAKRALFLDHLPRSGGRAVINVDDAEGRALVELVGPTAVTTSVEGRPATWRCVSFKQRLEGMELELDTPDGPREVRTRLLGAFNASNLLQTLAATTLLGVPLDLAIEALQTTRGVPGRLQHLGGSGRPHVFVDYAHTPDALERALDAVSELGADAVTVVFGCGGDRDRDKRPKMGAIAARGADRVILTSDNPRSEEPQAILDEIARGIDGTYEVCVDRADAIRAAVASAGDRDVILIAGKGHETYQEIRGVRRDFDDAAHAQAALNAYPVSSK